MTDQSLGVLVPQSHHSSPAFAAPASRSQHQDSNRSASATQHTGTAMTFQRMPAHPGQDSKETRQIHDGCQASGDTVAEFLVCQIGMQIQRRERRLSSDKRVAITR